MNTEAKMSAILRTLERDPYCCKGYACEELAAPEIVSRIENPADPISGHFCSMDCYYNPLNGAELSNA